MVGSGVFWGGEMISSHRETCQIVTYSDEDYEYFLNAYNNKDILEIFGKKYLITSIDVVGCYTMTCTVLMERVFYL